MKFLSLFLLMFSLSLFSQDSQVDEKEKEIESLLVELEENGYDEKEILNSNQDTNTRLPASTEE